MSSERRFILKLNAFESGALIALLHQDGKGRRLTEVIKQLKEHQGQIRKEAGVTTEYVGNGYFKMTDKHGNIIIRKPYEWER